MLARSSAALSFVAMFVVLLGAVATTRVSAQTNEMAAPAAGSFSLRPGRIAAVLKPGEERTVQIEVTNHAGEERTFAVEVEDLAAGDTSDAPSALFGALPGPYPAKGWIRPRQTEFTLQPGQRLSLPVTIRVPLQADAGDHYAAVLVRRALTPDEAGTAGFNVVSRVGTTLLLSIDGDVVRDARLTTLRPQQSLFWSLPAALELTAQNDGTVFAYPEGVVEIRNMLGVTVGEMPVADWYVLRGSKKQFELEWRPLFAIGRYVAVADMRVYGQPMEPLKTSFWVIPALPILLALLVALIASFVVQSPFARKR